MKYLIAIITPDPFKVSDISYKAKVNYTREIRKIAIHEKFHSLIDRIILYDTTFYVALIFWRDEFYVHSNEFGRCYYIRNNRTIKNKILNHIFSFLQFLIDFLGYFFVLRFNKMNEAIYDLIRMKKYLRDSDFQNIEAEQSFLKNFKKNVDFRLKYILYQIYLTEKEYYEKWIKDKTYNYLLFESKI
jgi:hypothetical protein